MIKKIVLIAEVDGDITKDSLRLSIDDEGSIVLYPKEETVNFKNCSIIKVSCGVRMSDEEMDAVDLISTIYKLHLMANDRGHIFDCSTEELMPLQLGVDAICEAIAFDKGALLLEEASKETIEVFKNLCSQIGIPTNWEE